MVNLQSKLPDVGTTIFTEMSALAGQHQALNLSQGFPDFPLDPELLERVAYYLREGKNQYAPMPGLPSLRQALARKYSRQWQADFDADTEITITSGATEALFAAIAALLHPGQETIILEPAYDSYGPAVRLNGGIPCYVPLESGSFRPNWPAIRQAVNTNTRLIIINTPHNPTGAVWHANDLNELESLLEEFPNLLVLSDEVYEHLIFDGLAHASVLSRPSLRKRSVAVFSFGKTFHATGWKVGYAIAPAALTAEVRKVHQYLTFSTHTPTQYALADYLQEPAHYQQLPGFYQQKRDFFLRLMKDSRLKALPCQGTYFQLFSYEGLSELPDREMAIWLTKTAGVASIPLSPFYSQAEQAADQKLLRLCFAKSDETLRQAADRLCKI